MQIVTGRRGEPHVTSRQMQAVYRSFLGDFALLDVGAHLAATATSNDNVRISDGVVAVQGIYAVIAYNEYDDNYIEPVSVGMKRIDTLILHYTKSNDIEDMQIEVVEGEEAVDNPVAPTIAEGGDAWEGTADIKVPIYDVLVTSFGLTVTPYSRMNTLIPTLDSIAERIPETVVTGVKGDSEVLYRDGNVNITKANVGLGDVDNTSDLSKPISNATQTALNLKADLTYVDAKISAAYHAGGSKTVAELVSALLIADNMGKVYNMSDSGVTTADFVEGAGEPINEGDNVGICNVGTEESPVYKFDLLSGFVDLSAYATTSAVNAGLAGKVDKVAGKGLSTEDYTDTEKQKLANIESNAQVNVQSDWNEDDTEDDGYIKNKPDLSTSLSATGNPLTIESSESNLVECVAEVEAVQDLHGYDHPWVGGAGKNKLSSIAGTVTKTGVTYTMSDNQKLTVSGVATGNSDYIINLSKPISLATGQTIYFKMFNFTGTLSPTNVGVWLNKYETMLGYFTATNKVLSYTATSDVTISKLTYRHYKSDTNNNYTVNLSLSVNEELTTFEPYENTSPITGQTEVVIEDVGKNLANDIYVNPSTSVYATTLMLKADLKPSTTYTISFEGTVGNTLYTNENLFYFENFTVVSGVNTVTVITQNNININDGRQGDGSAWAIFKNSADQSSPNIFENLMLEQGSTATTYEPYKGKTYTIQLGDTIYGGELDVLTGELRVDKVKRQITSTIGTGWQAESGREHSFYVYDNVFVPSAFSGLTIKDDARFVCDAFPTVTPTSCYNGNLGVAKEVNRLRLANPSWSTVSDVTSYLSNNEVYVVYELAEPYTIQLTPQQIRLLKGTNNISCNTGDLSIEYYPDNVLGQLKGDIESEYDERVEVLENQTQELLPSLTFMSRERRNITSDLGRLSTAVAEQNLAKYGYKIGDYFTGASRYTYILADYNTFKGTSTPYCLTQNHLGIVVDTHQTSQWYSEDASSAGYNGSTLHTYLKGTVMDNIKSDFIALFGGSTGLEHLLSHSKILTTALANWAWQANQYISALTCTQIDAGSQWTANGFQEGEASKSLELFRKYKWTEIFGSEYPWLRDLSNYGTGGAYACYADGAGHLHGGSSVTPSYFVVGLINFY